MCRVTRKARGRTIHVEYLELKSEGVIVLLDDGEDLLGGERGDGIHCLPRLDLGHEVVRDGADVHEIRREARCGVLALSPSPHVLFDWHEAQDNQYGDITYLVGISTSRPSKQER